jgi:ABC-type sulfate transport system permease component
MLSPTQILIIIVVSILTVVLAIIGVQVFLILKEGKRSVEKVNKMLDDAGSISSAVTKPITSLFNSVGNFPGFGGLLGWLINRKKKREGQKENQEEKKDE